MAKFDDMINLNPTFAVNDYQKPKYLSERESKIFDILMVLFGKPGFYPSIPTLGMNIQQYLYMFEDEVSAEAIKSKLVEQCEDFDNDINTEELDVITTVYKERLMIIFILPLINDTNKVSVALGVTTNTAGEIIFNSVDTNSSQLL